MQTFSENTWKQYEEYLRGEKAEYEMVNSHELKLVKEGKRGNDIVLSIDINLNWGNLSFIV